MEGAEKNHFLHVCWSLVGYETYMMHDVARMQRAISELDDVELELLGQDTHRWNAEVLRCIAANAMFLNQLPSPFVCCEDLGPDAEEIVSRMPPGHRVTSRNSSKVCYTLRQFVRDWAKEGQEERDSCYQPLIDALLKYLPPNKSNDEQPSVLCPGCGLGRLPFEFARQGYVAEGNEFSYHMLLGSQLILNRSPDEECHTIYPFVLNSSCLKERFDSFRPIRVPDSSPYQEMPAGARLSMAAGEFVEVYKEQGGQWDAVATCFFLDTAKNVFLYIRTIAMLIRPGGFWTNFGPLLYHYAEMEQDISIEPSWEEVKPSIAKYFDIREESHAHASYTSNLGSFSTVIYRCIFFIGQRNDTPISGESNPVF
uniref:carnosine N-methyltransferase n=1 Tax=Noctiluca scintillans TaxID=2966 RepID=A0A7S0ZSU7_NOCSC